MALLHTRSSEGPDEMPSGRKRVLVIEDEALIGIYLETLLLELGYDCVGPVARLSEAIREAETARVDAAVLNLILDGQPAYAVAEILDRRSIPFGFASGVPQLLVSPEWNARPRIEKPYTAEGVRPFLLTLLGQSRSDSRLKATRG